MQQLDSTPKNIATIPPPLEEVHRRILPFCQSNPIQKLEVFGSVSRGEAEAGSDVDFMVTFDPGANVSCEQFLHLKEALAQILGCPVDLMERKTVEQHQNEIRRRHMLRSARTVYAKA